NYINCIKNNTDIIAPANSKELAICGYSNKIVDDNTINEILSRLPVRGIDYRSNIYELLGIFVLKKGDNSIEKDLLEKYAKSTLENKYLIYKIYPKIKEKLKNDVENLHDTNAAIIKNILDDKIELV